MIIFLFIGIVLKETRKAYTDDEERNVTASQKFSKFHYWNLDKKPSQDDKFQQTLDWMEIAKVVSQCIFFPAHMAKVNFWFHWTSVIFNDNTVLPRSIAPRFIANLTYRQNSRLSRFPPLKIPRYTAKLSYRHRFSGTKVVKPI